MTPTTDQQVEKRRELISKEYIRGGLVRKMVTEGLNSLSSDELEGLHALDKELGPIDMKQLFFDEIAYLRQNPSPAVVDLSYAADIMATTLKTVRIGLEVANQSCSAEEARHNAVHINRIDEALVLFKRVLAAYEAEVGKK